MWFIAALVWGLAIGQRLATRGHSQGLHTMMILPFVLFSGAILAGWGRYSLISIILWLAGLAAMMAMFRYHVTSALDLAF